MNQGLRRAVAWSLGTPFFEGNAIDVLQNGVQIFPAMLDAIRAAEERIDFLTFVYWRGAAAHDFAEALSEAAGRGVRVRVLLDGIGSLPMEPDLARGMKRAGVDLHWFRPARRWLAELTRMPHRTHRKILVCDGRVGFTGGVGIGEEWEGDARGPREWRETHFRVRGPALQGLNAAFLENWIEAAGGSDTTPGLRPPEPVGTLPVAVVRASGGPGWSDRATLLRTLVDEARESIRLSSPYFVPDEATTRLLSSAARRGVRVEILVPGPHVDHRVSKVAGERQYETLLEAGVSIHEYQPTMIHQKISVYDASIVSIGSGNLNQRSFGKDDEVQLVVADQGFARSIGDMLDDDFASSTPVVPGQWKRRGLLRRVGEWIVWGVRRHV